MADPCISCTTFNILAPIYKRLDKEEFWVGNEELVQIYEKGLGDAGYTNFKLARTNNRGDGLLTAVHKDYFKVLDYQGFLFNDFGDRVAQLLYVESVVPLTRNVKQEFLIVNTHLLFPHNASLSIVRLRQYHLCEASLNENGAFVFLKGDSHGDYITYSTFCEALHQVGLTGHPHGLSPEATLDLWMQVDSDTNGVIGYSEFLQWIWNPAWLNQSEEDLEQDERKVTGDQAFGFNVKNADLFPREVEKGTWPENYSLSDHARLTVVFSPVRLPACLQPICL
ncbi:hypothetical protein Scep_025162 [Stephania cephalantha]|uniref:EF-hand domain-containing protein n=1 Tax=Stephania cephalantha TaxID=152367 RepID=A0AAP0ENB2_9MAGN